MIAGRYTLEREIGRGGSGTVHLAHDEVLGRTVAIKRIGVMPGADAADMQRAEREARLAASLNHPHVVAVFDLVEEDDCHWLVMEYVEGQTLAQLVRTEGPLETTAAAALLAQTADALTDAHAGGIVHRDVKPSNILVSDGVAKLSDFGIARSANDVSLTQTGLVTGFARLPRSRGGVGFVRDARERRVVPGRDALPRGVREAAVRRGRQPDRRALQDRPRGAAEPSRRAPDGGSAQRDAGA